MYGAAERNNVTLLLLKGSSGLLQFLLERNGRRLTSSNSDLRDRISLKKDTVIFFIRTIFSICF